MHWYELTPGQRAALAESVSSTSLKGEWDSSTTYTKNDVVSRNGVTWFALTQNSNEDPALTGLPQLSGASGTRYSDAGPFGQPAKQAFTVNSPTTVTAINVYSGTAFTSGKHIGISSAFSGSSPAWLGKRTIAGADIGVGAHSLLLDAPVPLVPGTTYWFVSEDPNINTGFGSLAAPSGVIATVDPNAYYGSTYSSVITGSAYLGFDLYSTPTPVWQQLVNADIVLGPKVAASTPGTVTGKIQAFDIEGNSIGFIPVYDAIS